MTLVWLMAAAVVGSVGTVLAAAGFLLLPDGWRRSLLAPLLSYATGMLLGTALLRLLPEAMMHAPVSRVMPVTLAGLVVFFLLERLVVLRHCHAEPGCATHGAAVPLVLLGDGLHNLVDGVVIGAAFVVSWSFGMATALAVVAHELPQELGDLAILLDGGLRPARALGWNAISASTTIPGALLAWYGLDWMQDAVPYVLAVAAASFLYIGLADLVPGLERPDEAARLRGPVLLLLGILTVVLLGEVHGD